MAEDDEALISLPRALKFWETGCCDAVDILKHHRFIHHLKHGHVIIEGVATDTDGLPSEHEHRSIPSDNFRRSFEFGPDGDVLHSINKDGRPVTFSHLAIMPDHLNAIRSLMEEEKPKDLRQNLFAHLAAGMMTPDEAEAEAERLSVGPLNPMPDIADFDPMKEARWSFPMALAWIVWRDRDMVREYWPKWLDQKYHWRKFEERQNGTDRSTHTHHLVPRLHDTALLDALRVDVSLLSNGDHAMEAEQANAELFIALTEGRLDPDGIDLSSGRRTPIAQAEFRDLQLLSDGQAEYLGVGLSQRLYDDPTLKRSCVVQRWPAKDHDPESQCKSWLIKEMQKSPTDPPMPRGDYEAQAKEKFGVGRVIFDRAWRAALNETGSEWTKPGPRPRKSQR